MSTFQVGIEKISEITVHPNADRLEIAKLDGMDYSFIVPKGEYKTDELVVYFPVDSVLPEEIITKLGMTGKLQGASKNRIKTMKLRGVVSQGIVAKQSMFWDDVHFAQGCDATTILGVEKYEPESEMLVAGGKGQLPPYLKRLPPEVTVYDIEGAERFKDIVDTYLMNARVYISEKVEGSHIAVLLDNDNKITVCQRKYAIQPEGIEELGRQHAWIEAVKASQLESILIEMKEYIKTNWNREVHDLVVRGELTGPKIQGNYYELQDYKIWIFEIEVNGIPVNYEPEFSELTKKFNLNTAPTLMFGWTLKEFLLGQTLDELSTGKSQINPDKLREGVVVKPCREIYDEKFGRVFIKQRSREYLLGSNT